MPPEVTTPAAAPPKASAPAKPAAQPKPAEKARVKLSTSMAGHKVSHKPGEVILVDRDEADRHVANGNGSIVDGPGEETENQKLRAENAQLRAALAQLDPEDDPK